MQTTVDIKKIQEKCSLKNIKHFVGHEGVGINADLHFEGVKTFFYLDDANGGGGVVEHIYNPEQYKKFQQWLETLPKYKYLPDPNMKDDSDFMKSEHKVTEDTIVDELFDEYITAKENKKRKAKVEKMFTNSFVIGKDYDEINYWKQKLPLSSYNKESLQKFYDNTVKPRLVGGVKLLNTNMEELGLKA